LEILDIIYVFC